MWRYTPSTISSPVWRVVVGGDFNSWASNTLDNTRGTSPSLPWLVAQPVLQALDLADGYRTLNPIGREVTRVSKTDGGGRRID